MSKDAKNNEWNVQINVEIFAKKKQDRADDIFGAYTLCFTFALSRLVI